MPPLDILLLTLVALCFLLSLLTLATQLYYQRKHQAALRSFQLPQTIIDLNNLKDSADRPGITVISNDVIESPDHPHHHQRPKTKLAISVINQHVKSDEKIDRDLETMNRSVDPLTEKITLDY